MWCGYGWIVQQELKQKSAFTFTYYYYKANAKSIQFGLAYGSARNGMPCRVEFRSETKQHITN